MRAYTTSRDALGALTALTVLACSGGDVPAPTDGISLVAVVAAEDLTPWKSYSPLVLGEQGPWAELEVADKLWITAEAPGAARVYVVARYDGDEWQTLWAGDVTDEMAHVFQGGMAVEVVPISLYVLASADTVATLDALPSAACPKGEVSDVCGAFAAVHAASPPAGARGGSLSGEGAQALGLGAAATASAGALRSRS